jgi:hypothetical protein
MTKKIIFNEITVNVLDCYPFRYDDGKEVLRISSIDTTFEVLKNLKDFTGIIKYYEDDILKTEYEDYSADFSCNYYKGEWSLELKKISKIEIALLQIQEKIETTWSAVDFILTEGL